MSSDIATDKAKKTLLVIEDSEEDFETLRWIFNTRLSVNCALEHYTDGDDALSYLQGEGTHRSNQKAILPDLILLDLNLPGTDGRDILSSIKTHNLLKHIPVVILTTSSNPRDVSDCYSKGANSYMLKPVDLERLVTSMSTLLRYWFDTVLLVER